MIVPVHVSNCPRTLLTMCRIENDSSECVGSTFHVERVETGAAAFEVCAGRLACAASSAGAKTRHANSLRIMLTLFS
jgi:hypothetical protein